MFKNMFKKIGFIILTFFLVSILFSAWSYIIMSSFDNTFSLVRSATNNYRMQVKIFLPHYLKTFSYLIDFLWVLIGAYVAYKASSLAKRYLDIKEKEKK